VGNAEPIAAGWAGRSCCAPLPKANHLGFLSGRGWMDSLLAGSRTPAPPGWPAR